MSALSEAINRLLPDGPRVLTTSMLDRIALSVSPGIMPLTSHRTIKVLEEQESLRKVSNGIFLNRLAVPPAEPSEAAGFLRRGAVVSLLTVLGDAGITNNYTYQVWAVIPIGPDMPGSGGEVVTKAATFRFHGVAHEVLHAPERSDLLDPEVSYARATPEAALCHWVYLASRKRKGIKGRLTELELDDLDMPRLERIAAAMGIASAMEDFLAGVRNLNDEQGGMPGLGI